VKVPVYHAVEVVDQSLCATTVNRRSAIVSPSSTARKRRHIEMQFDELIRRGFSMKIEPREPI
jgi:hypothetical protein